MLQCDRSAPIWFTQCRNRDDKPQLSLLSLPMVVQPSGPLLHLANNGCPMQTSLAPAGWSKRPHFAAGVLAAARVTRGVAAGDLVAAASLLRDFVAAGVLEGLVPFARAPAALATFVATDGDSGPGEL